MWHVWGTREVNTGVLRGILSERDLFNVGLTEVSLNGLDWIYLAQEREARLVLVTAIWKLRIPSDGRNSSLAVEISAFKMESSQ